MFYRLFFFLNTFKARNNPPQLFQCSFSRLLPIGKWNHHLLVALVRNAGLSWFFPLLHSPNSSDYWVDSNTKIYFQPVPSHLPTWNTARVSWLASPPPNTAATGPAVHSPAGVHWSQRPCRSLVRTQTFHLVWPGRCSPPLTHLISCTLCSLPSSHPRLLLSLKHTKVFFLPRLLRMRLVPLSRMPSNQLLGEPSPWATNQQYTHQPTHFLAENRCLLIWLNEWIGYLNLK